jgi:6-phosphogluconate dehydrogenase
LGGSADQAAIENGGEMTAELGIVGLGRIGAGMVRRLRRAGVDVAGFDVDAGARAALEADGVETCSSLGQLAARLTAPRVVWVVVPAGEAVAQTVSALAGELEKGDLVVDGGNSDYRDSIERAGQLATHGIHFVDVGTSGGVHGEEGGFCLMVGGEESLVERLRPFLQHLAPDSERGWARLGGVGSGHFTKMVHNGIEYGMMQAYAEGFALLAARGDLGIDPARVAELWGDGSIIRSWLLELVAESLRDGDRLAEIAPHVADSGMGRWAVREAIDRGVPVPVLTASLMQRLRSRDEGAFGDRLLAALRQRFGGHAVRREES